ncbi:hypothetical protein BG842_13675 [Haladaptatus sp. W1]|nr:hypothetical protein BG842_13675 [Haladaptatus sp. W1]
MALHGIHLEPPSSGLHHGPDELALAHIEFVGMRLPLLFLIFRNVRLYDSPFRPVIGHGFPSHPEYIKLSHGE